MRAGAQALCARCAPAAKVVRWRFGRCVGGAEERVSQPHAGDVCVAGRTARGARLLVSCCACLCFLGLTMRVCLVFRSIPCASFPMFLLALSLRCLPFPFLSTNLSHAGTWPRLRGALCGPIIKVSRSRHTERLACGWRKDTRGAGKKAPNKEEVCGSVWGIDGEQVSRLGNTAGGQG